MLAVAGTYQNGQIKLDELVSSTSPVKVIVTFLDEIKPEVEKRLTIADFSFTQARKDTETYTGSFSDAVIEERRNEL